MKAKGTEIPYPLENSWTRARIDSSIIFDRYKKIEQIIEEYENGYSRNALTNDKYFRKILEVFEAD